MDPYSETPGMIWNGGLNTKFFDKNDGLIYEAIKISDKEAEELGDIKLLATKKFTFPSPLSVRKIYPKS